MEMSNPTGKLKTLKLDLSEDILVHLVLIFLLTQFSQFKVSYNAQKDEWTINELISYCVQEKDKLKQEMTESTHLASTFQDKAANKKDKGIKERKL